MQAHLGGIKLHQQCPILNDEGKRFLNRTTQTDFERSFTKSSERLERTCVERRQHQRKFDVVNTVQNQWIFMEFLRMTRRVFLVQKHRSMMLLPNVDDVTNR